MDSIKLTTGHYVSNKMFLLVFTVLLISVVIKEATFCLMTLVGVLVNKPRGKPPGKYQSVSGSLYVIHTDLTQD